MNLLRLWRWVFNVECSEPFCQQRRVCWRWHVETIKCPTCSTELTEFHPWFDHALQMTPVKPLKMGNYVNPYMGTIMTWPLSADNPLTR